MNEIQGCESAWMVALQVCTTCWTWTAVGLALALSRGSYGRPSQAFTVLPKYQGSYSIMRSVCK
jgi:hypothetical protein